MRHNFKTMYEIVDALRARPAMFIGNVFFNEPFATFLAFLHGLSFAEIDPGMPSIWGFNRWITARVRGISTVLPSDWLHKKYGSKRALEVYLRYLDEYRACKEIEIASMEPVDLVPTFTIRDANAVTPPQPTRLFIGQYYPSKVFFLGEQYGDTIERWFPYHRAEKGVVEQAKSRWNAPVSAWRRRRSTRSTGAAGRAANRGKCR